MVKRPPKNVLISDITLNENNPRLIKDDKFKKLVQSLKDFPEMADVRPVVVNKDMVILGGNMRYKAALEAGWKEIPVIVVDWSEDKQREFIIKDNVSGGEWDWDLIANEWDTTKLEEWGVDLPPDLLKTEVEEDEVPEVSSEPEISQLGEVYQLGRHRVMCGDSTKIEDVEKLMHGKKADMVFTDPPYGVGYNGGAKKRDELIGDEVGNDVYAPSLMVSKEFVKPDASLYLWYADANISSAAAAAADWVVTAQIIWVKNNAQFVSSAHYHGKHEPCLYAHRKGKSAQWYGENNEVTVWEVDRANKNEFHPTQKPVELASRACQNSTNNDGLVLDLFLGSGSTLIACEQTNRICYGMELDPKYVDVIRKRYSKYVGKEQEWQIQTPAL